MANTKFYLDNRRTKSGQPSVLKLVISHNHKVRYISLDVKLFPNQWDELKERVQNHPEKHRLNLYITCIKQKADAHILNLVSSMSIIGMTVNDIRDSIKSEFFPEENKNITDEKSFLFRFNKYSLRMNPGTKRIFDHTLNRLVSFCGEEKLAELQFEDITVDWLKDFDLFMSKTAPSKNSRNIHLRNIRTVFNDAINDNITNFYPFRRFKIKGEVTANRDLSVEELRRLAYFECEECAVKYGDYFMLMFFLMGINNVDLCHLKEIKKGRIEFHRAKTHHFFSMKI